LLRGALVSATLLLLGACTSSADDTTSGPPRGPACGTVDGDDAPPWVELAVTIRLEDPPFDFSRANVRDERVREAVFEERKVQVAPIQAPVLERLAKIGAREVSALWLTTTVHGWVRARDVREVSCWPEVLGVSTTDGVVCTDDDCPSKCASKPAHACGEGCAAVLAERFDLARGCRLGEQPLACVDSYRILGGRLACYVRPSTGDVFVTRYPYLSLLGVEDLALCSRAQGGEDDPSAMPICL
jgi:hypothetical protein